MSVRGKVIEEENAGNVFLDVARCLTVLVLLCLGKRNSSNVFLYVVRCGCLTEFGILCVRGKIIELETFVLEIMF